MATELAKDMAEVTRQEAEVAEVASHDLQRLTECIHWIDAIRSQVDYVEDGIRDAEDALIYIHEIAGMVNERLFAVRCHFDGYTDDEIPF